ncbi:MAG: hypothetical protein OXF51_01275, partial [Alphaproteobacteria bacterium]|nr:hypothetical protein [Alphaproteobacteria bacterium]
MIKAIFFAFEISGGLDTRVARDNRHEAVIPLGIVVEIAHCHRPPALGAEHIGAFLVEIGSNTAGAEMRTLLHDRDHARDVVLAWDHTQFNIVLLLEHGADGDGLSIAGRGGAIGCDRHRLRQVGGGGRGRQASGDCRCSENTQVHRGPSLLFLLYLAGLCGLLQAPSRGQRHGGFCPFRLAGTG